jgi:tetratricopeptide (TPR) repeat protein
MDSTVKTANQAAVRLQNQGKLDEACVVLEPHCQPPFTSLTDDQQLAIYQLADIYFDQERLKESEALITAALVHADPVHEGDLRLLLSQIFDKRGHTRKAAAERERVAALEPQIPEDIVRLLLRRNRLNLEKDYEEAYKTTAELLALAKTNKTLNEGEIQCVLAWSAYQIGRYDDAWRLATQGGAHPSSSIGAKTDALRLKASIALPQGSFPQALELLASAFPLARRGASYAHIGALLTTTCNTLLLLGRVTETRQLILEAQERFMLPGLSEILAQCELAQGDPNAAEAVLPKKGSQLIPALIALDREDYVTALKCFDAHLSEPHNETARLSCRLLRTSTLGKLGRREEAEAERAALAACISERMPRLTLCQQQRMQAHLAEVDNDAVAAVGFWKQVLRLEPFPVNQPSNWVRLGDAYARQGEAAAARFAWERAAAQPVESIWVRRANERLELD